MRKILFIFLTTLLLLIVSCAKKEAPIPVENIEKSLTKPELIDCGKDIACFISSSVKGEKSVVEVLQNDPTTGKNTGTSLFESKGKMNSDIIIYQKIKSVNTKVLFEDKEASITPEERPCFEVVKKEVVGFSKQMEGKEVTCKISASDLSNVNDEQVLNELISSAISQSLEQEGEADPLNPFAIKLRPKQDGLCSGTLLNYMGSAMTEMFGLFQRIAEAPECKSLITQGKQIPGMTQSSGGP